MRRVQNVLRTLRRCTRRIKIWLFFHCIVFILLFVINMCIMIRCFFRFRQGKRIETLINRGPERDQNSCENQQ